MPLIVLSPSRLLSVSDGDATSGGCIFIVSSCYMLAPGHSRTTRIVRR